MERRSLGGDVFVEEHNFWLTSGRGDLPMSLRRGVSGLITAHENAALITAGINTGVVSVTLDLVPERPADPDTADWDDVVEASIAHVNSGIALPYLRMEHWKYLPTDKPGPYRVRVYVRGRDIDRDGVAETAFEQYRLQVWPEDVSPETHCKLTDRTGAEGRESLARNSALPEPQPVPDTNRTTTAHESRRTHHLRTGESPARSRTTRPRTGRPTRQRTLNSKDVVARAIAFATSPEERADAGRKQWQTLTTALTGLHGIDET
jgi:hypothetical protein